VTKSGERQEIPAASGARNIEKAIGTKQPEQKQVFDALVAAGFELSWQPSQTSARFRDLQAEPLVGAVAKFT